MYRPYMLDAGSNLNEREFKKPASEFSVPDALHPLTLSHNGRACWVGPVGLKTNKKGIDPRAMYSSSLGDTRRQCDNARMGAYIKALSEPEYYQGTPDDALKALTDGDLSCVILSEDLAVSMSGRRYSIMYQGIILKDKTSLQAKKLLQELAEWN